MNEIKYCNMWFVAACHQT